MKNFLKAFIIIAMVFMVFPANVFAEDLNNDTQIVKTTNEPLMPSDEEMAPFSLNNNKSAREIWVDEVVRINEEAYGQSIANVEEDDNYYIFNFEPNPELEDKVVIIGGEEYVNVQIDRILYVKPESSINRSFEMSPSAIIPDLGGSGGTTKIVEYYGWSNGYQKYQGKSGNFGSILNLLIGYVPTKSVLVSWILSEALGSIYNSLTSSTYVTAESYNKYYYRNKAGCVYSTTAKGWLPIAHVGERRSFGWSWGTYKNSSGEPILKKGTVKNANNSKNPTNQDSREKKPHYDDNTWIMNKAKETQNTGGYWDCFGIVTTLY